ncbi:MAG: YggS family pyridoxal phosphate-dependent enzyme [Oscillospiraceae bacterium]|nr:YggS family pyridoxal phosphate-dependent enzyme [Oscillospiraceae bacterium]
MANEFAPCTEAQKQAVLERLAAIRQKIAAACQDSGRSESEVTLMAVTKTVSPELINLAVDAGVTTLGENRVQEYLSKRDAYRADAEVQFIGHLQTNKVKQIIDKVTLIHSVDSLHLAEAISKAAEKQGIVMPVLLEVNIGGEASKSGVSPDELPALLDAVQKLPAVRADGLMTIPPPMTDEAEQIRVFTQMKQLFDSLRQSVPMQVLSMGMSGDYEAAVRCGATIVRIGSALFGARSYPPKNEG